jgi:hypothetical protein
MWLWTAVATLAGIGVGAYGGYGHHTRRTTVEITVGLAGGFLAFALLSSFIAYWVAIAPRRQRNETAVALRDHEQRAEEADALSIGISVISPGRFGPNKDTRGLPGWSQGVLVENRGPGGRFRVHTVTHFQGLEVEDYGSGVALAWEQSEENEHHLSRGASGNLKFFISYVFEGQRLRLWIPPSAYGSTFGLGTELRMTGESVRFRIAITDIERDRSAFYDTRIRFEGQDSRPLLSFNKVKV